MVGKDINILDLVQLHAKQLPNTILQNKRTILKVREISQQKMKARRQSQEHVQEYTQGGPKAKK